ncbi:hypothetical protein PAMP_005981 [Pampus punctatissimus]
MEILFSKCTAMTKKCHGRREDEPITFSHLLRHFILPQQEVQCANSPPRLTDWTLHVNTPDVPSSHYAVWAGEACTLSQR